MAKDVLRAALEKERRALRRALAAGVLVTLSSIGLSGTSAWLIVRAAQMPAVLSLTVPMGLVQLFALSKAAGRYLERTQTHRAALGVMGHVRARVARLLEPLIPAGLGPKSADVVDVVLRDVDRVQDLLSAVVGPLVSASVAGVFTVVLSALIVPMTGVTLLVGVVVSAFALPLLGAALGHRSEVAMDRVRHEMVALFDDVAQGGDEYVMSGASAHLERELSNLEERYDAAHWRHTLLRGVLSALTALLSGLCVVGAVIFSASALREGHLTTSLLAVPALLSVAALELISGIAPIVVGFRGDREALTRLEGIADLDAPVHEPPVEGPSTTQSLRTHAHALRRDYDGATLFRDVSFTLRHGDVVLLRGPSGAGKTTLARIIAKFLDPSGGELTFDNRDSSTLTSRQVRDLVGYVDDAPHVFSTTLAGNLRIAAPRASDEELLAALHHAGLDALLRTMPDGLETMLGGSSLGLSGGERRRLGLARELLVKRPVMIIDEPTEGLDEVSAAWVMGSIAREFSHGLVIVISHREHDGVVASRTLVLENGTLREQANESIHLAT